MKPKCPTCGDRKGPCFRCAKAAGRRRVLPPMVGSKIVVPKPPRLLLRPSASACLVTLVIGQEAEACFMASEKPMRRYAAEHGLDFVVLTDWVGHPGWSMSAKFGIPRVLEYYERALYADADVLFRRNAVDILALAGDADYAAVDTKPHHEAQGGGVLAKYEQFLELHGLGAPTPFYFNCGVQVFSRAARIALEAPDFPVLPSHCSEEWLVNARVWKLKNVRSIDRRANWQNWTDTNFMSAPDDAVLHWSGGGLFRKQRAQLMMEAARGEA